MPGPLDGQIALVTGGSRGIGKAIALRLAADGATLAINCRSNTEAADAVAEKITAAGGKANVYQADIASADDISAMVEKIQTELGPITILVNNAGITRDRPFGAMSYDDWSAVINTNLNSVYHTAQACIKDMVRNKSGRIINISSIVGQMGNVGQANYAAAKAGLIGLTKSLAKELARKNITVNAIAPGFIETDMTAEMPARAMEAVLPMIPLKRIGKPEDVAAAVSYLAGPGGDYVTGQTIAINGGLYM